MTYYQAPVSADKGLSNRIRSVPISVSHTTTTLQHATYGQVDGPTDCRPRMIPFPTRNDYGQSIGQFHHQQQQQQQGRQQSQHQHQRPQMQARSAHPSYDTMAPYGPSRQQNVAVTSVVTTLLPFCTAEIPLNESQVISVTDVAGSLKELMLLALGAKDGDEECMSRLEGALGTEHAVNGVVDFFSDEFEIE